MNYELLNEIIATMRRNKLRTALTGFAVAWGIFMLIFLLGAGNGLINAQRKGMDRFLANSMMVGGGVTTKAHDGLPEGRYITLDDDDISTTKRAFADNVDEAGGMISQSSVTINHGADYVSSTMRGVAPNYAAVEKVQMLSGRFINELDMSESRRVVVLSDNDAKELMPRRADMIVGQYLTVSGMTFKVVGIYKSDNTDMNTETYVPFTTLQTIYGKGRQADNIIFTFHGLESEAANDAFEAQYKARLNLNHRAAPDDEGSVWIWNRFKQNLQMSTGITIIQTALWVIGLLTLVSGIVGVSNIMLITVKERTREFGIRKAIGARPGAILKLIIVESVAMTTFFGYIGMMLGMAANMYMDATIGHETVNVGPFEATVFLDPTVGFGTCVGATVVMVVAGTLAGLVPALKAARIRPIEALRAE